jgi:hypothetical protein
LKDRIVDKVAKEVDRFSKEKGYLTSPKRAVVKLVLEAYERVLKDMLR